MKRRTDIHSSLTPTQSAQLSQDEYNICVFLQDQLAPSQVQVTSTTRPSLSSMQSITEDGITGTGTCSGNANGAIQIPSTTVISISSSLSGNLPFVATFYADIVPSLLDIDSTTTLIATGSATGTSTLKVGPSGLCKLTNICPTCFAVRY